MVEEAMLSPYRALDLTDDQGFLCGRILADLGADVIKIEPPGGHPSRNIGPFFQDIPEPEKSLYWFAYNANKRGITLNLETRDGQEIFKGLVTTADFVIESFPPQYMDEFGLGFQVLSKINPRIVMTSITPFGQDGPRSHYKTSDLIAMATGGVMFLWGNPDRPPLRCSVDQAYLQAGAQAAVGTMFAHHWRQLTGAGQHIDVSIQEAVIGSLQFSQEYWDAQKIIYSRHGDHDFRGKIVRRVIWPCRDGYVAWHLNTGLYGRSIRYLVEWMESEGAAGNLGQVPWEQTDWRELTQPQVEEWEKIFAPFFLAHTKSELHEEAIKRGIFLFPVSTTKELFGNKQLASRGYWRELHHAELEASLIYPGPPFQSAQAPWQLRQRAPLVGEHNEQIYIDELGFSKEELITFKEANII
jgi:crotonobetainyl-CoA:carnitine CoA-transferase CaiB-like acyl-CoA transferase